MKSTKVLKLVGTIALIAVLVASFANIALAYDPGNITPDTGAGEQVAGIGEQIIGIIQVVGSLVAVGVIVVLGIKYMMGSASEKAEYKKTMLPYLIGAVLIFAGVNIAKAIYNMANQLSVS